MAQTLKLKRSAVSGNAPSTGDLALGEIAINTYDGKIFIKKDDGTESIVTFEAGGSSNAGTIEEDSFSGNGSTTAFTLTTAPSSEENLLVFIDATFQNRDSFTISGTTITFDTAPDNGTSVRVYHVIPGTVDDGILTIAKFAADTLVIEAEGISSNDNDTTIPTSAAVKDYVDTQVATVDTLPEVLANGNTTGGTDISVSSGDDITFADSSKAIFGTDSDLELYHNGSNAFLTNTTGDLYIQDTNGSIRIRPKTGESGIDVLADGAVNLYYDNTSVLSTTADGISVTSEVEADEFIGDLRGAVLFKAQAGENVTKGDVVYISGISGNTTVVSKADADDASKMPAFGIVAATTTSGQPVDIYTQGILGSLDTSAYSEGDELFVSTTAGALTNTPPTGETAAIQKIAKVTRSNNLSGSIFITGAGRSNATPNLDEDQFFLGNASNQAVATDFSDAVEALSINNVVEDTTPQLGGDLASNGNDILFADNDKAIFGTGSDLQIYHDGDSSYISHNTTGTDLVIEATSPGDDVIVRAADDLNFRVNGNENGIVVVGGGATSLYHANSAKLATTSTGIDVTGTATMDGLTVDGDAIIQDATPTLEFKDTDNNLIASVAGASGSLLLKADTGSGTSGESMQFHTGGTERMRIDASGNLLVGTTNTVLYNNTTANTGGGAFIKDGLGTRLDVSRDNTCLTLNRPTTDGLMIDLYKGTTNVGGIGVAASNNLYIGALAANHAGLYFSDDGANGVITPIEAGSLIDNSVSLGSGSYRFKDLYLSGEVEATALDINGNGDISGNLTLGGYLAGPATFTIDPAAVGDNTGTVVIAGNLQVDGTTTTINSTTLTVDDKLITLASGSANAAAANGAGITVDGASATITYDGTNDEWDFNKNVKVSGSIGVTNIVTNKVVKFNGTILDDSMITDNGTSVGIDQPSPSSTYKLDVNGAIRSATAAPSFALQETDASNQTWLMGSYGGTFAVRDTTVAGSSYPLQIQAATPNNTLFLKSDGNVGIGTSSPSAKFQVEEYGIDTTETSTTATTQVAIHTMSATTFRSARFTVQVTNSTDSTYHLTEILMIHDGTTPSITEYGTIFTGSAEATFDADISSGNVRLLATPASTDTMEFKVVAHSITT